MLSPRVAVVHAALLCCACPGRAPRPPAPGANTRHIINEVFSTLKIKAKLNSNKTDFSAILKHLVDLSRHKDDKWNKIVKLTSFDINISNGSTDYMTAVNQVLHRENITGEFDDDVARDGKNFLRKLTEAYLRSRSARSAGAGSRAPPAPPRSPRGRPGASSAGHHHADAQAGLARNCTHEIEKWAPGDARRIFRGSTTRIAHYPFVASVHLFRRFVCAGAILSSDLVITAASCLQLAHNNRFYRENPMFLTVRVGSSYSGAGGDQVPVLEVHFHGAYEPDSLRHNLAIMRLRNHVIFRGSARVKSIEVDENAHALPANTEGVIIVGWGAKTAGNRVEKLDNKLSVSVLGFYPLEDCQEIYSRTFVTERNFCAGYLSHGAGACNRDVGAPGVVGGRLVGVASFGSAVCGATDAPTVFTKLGYYTAWIEEIMGQDEHKRSASAPDPRPRARWHTIMTTTLRTHQDFIDKIQPLDESNQPLKSITEIENPLRYNLESKDLSKDLRDPLVRHVNNEEPASHEQRKESMEQAEHDGDHQAELGNNNREHMNLISKPNFRPEEYIPSVMKPQHFIMREKISSNTIDELPGVDTVETNTNEDKQRSGFDLGVRKNIEVTAGTGLELARFGHLGAKEFVALGKPFGEVNFALTKKHNEKNKLPEIKISTKKVITESLDKLERHFYLSGVQKDTASDSIFKSNQFGPRNTKDTAIQPPPETDVPGKQTSEENNDLENGAQPTIDGRGPEATFPGTGLNEQIDELIDYMDIIDTMTSEEEEEDGSNGVKDDKLKIKQEAVPIDDIMLSFEYVNEAK